MKEYLNEKTKNFIKNDFIINNKTFYSNTCVYRLKNVKPNWGISSTNDKRGNQLDDCQSNRNDFLNSD